MRFSTALRHYPLYGGASAVSADVPGLFPVALDGHGYLVDLQRYERESIETLRQQADDSDQPSERSFNPAALWRRSVESWHHGAGQTNYDLTDSDRARYRTSKGVDPWTPGQISLLPDTVEARESENTNVRAVVAGTRLYLIDGQELLYSTDGENFTAVTDTPSETATSVTTDGYRVWVAYPSGPYVTNTGTGAASTFGTQDVDLIGYVNGRLIATHDQVVFELDGTGTATTLFTHPNSQFRWDVIAAAPNALYVAGHAGTKGEVYRFDVEDTDTTLSAPFSATSLPDGEYVTAALAYIGVVILGTNRGVRVASADSAGNLLYGPLVTETGGAVQCLEGEDRFVWFGWTAYDAASSGLGRMDLSVFTATLRPAYASDLMVADTAAVLSVVTFLDKRWFTISGAGLYSESDDLVASGTLEQGVIRWGTTERKIVVNADVRTKPLPAGASITLAAAYDDDTFDTVATLDGVNATGPTTAYSTRETATEQAEQRLTLARATDTTEGPTVLRTTLKSLVTPARAERILVPFLLHEQVLTGVDGAEVGYDTAAEFRFLKGLEASGRIVTYQEGNQSWPVTVQRVGFDPESWTRNRAWFNGTALVLLETIA